VLQRLAHSILLLGGWRRLGVAALAGAAAAFSMPPIDLLPALLLSFPVAIWLIDGATAGPDHWSWRTFRSAFTAGWAFGFGYFVAGFWWLGAAFLVEDDTFAWALPFGVIGFPAALALFHGLGFMLARLFWSPGSRRIFAFVGAMASVEWLRGIILTGFPWNSLGQALGASDATAQIASVTGLNGMTILVLFVFAAPAVLATGITAIQRIALPAIATVVLAGIASFGIWRLQSTPVTLLPDVKVRILQPNMRQREKHRLSGQEVLARYLTLSDRPTTPGNSGIADITHLIWPESPFPFLLAREPQALSQIAGLIRPRTTLITGAARAEDASGDARQTRYFNAIHIVGPDGIIIDSYDKVHLVPFGEYLPFKAAFAAIGLRQFVEIPGGFEAGARRKPMQIKGLPAALPLICYEAIFPSGLIPDGPRPGLLLNVTNDGWFGNTAGPYQHLAQARLRSVEQGLPQLRAANTGISAIIDPLGRVTGSQSLGTSGVIDGSIAKALPVTIYGSYGDIIAIIMLIVSFGLCFSQKSRYLKIR
jgi:apolipoprotein N-acyltransferase